MPVNVDQFARKPKRSVGIHCVSLAKSFQLGGRNGIRHGRQTAVEQRNQAVMLRQLKQAVPIEIAALLQNESRARGKRAVRIVGATSQDQIKLGAENASVCKFGGWKARWRRLRQCVIVSFEA